ncbi:MAG: hypothetical protein GC168_00130 [Candidatus Hydrogenedens sp.]|nr:hypothetical protein [Candidatus Hydrogenedens sp.]
MLATTPAWTEFTLATFEADITVPLGHALMGGGIPAASSVADPLRAQGVVLRGTEPTVVWVSLDWCEVRNDAYDRWRAVLAEAADTTPSRVLVSAIHQHEAPVVDYTAQRLLDGVGLENALCDVAFSETALARTAAALRDALASAVTVTHYGTGEARVEDIASNRRVVSPEGVVSFDRGSATKDPALRDQPAGEIDPMLKTLSFWNGDAPVAALSVYATHPMSYYGTGAISADFIGMARDQRQAETPGVRQIYFSGCSGDVTAGKFNDGDPANRAWLAQRLHAGMAAAWQQTTRHPLEKVVLRTADLVLPLKNTEGFSEEEMLHTLKNTSATIFQRCLAAMGLSWRKRMAEGRPIEVAAVDFGGAQWLLLPAEAFVHYQLAAQAMRPDQFILTAGYGECAPGYIPSASAAAEGFNDAHSWCWVGPGAAEQMHAAMRFALHSAQE